MSLRKGNFRKVALGSGFIRGPGWCLPVYWWRGLDRTGKIPAKTIGIVPRLPMTDLQLKALKSHLQSLSTSMFPNKTRPSLYNYYVPVERAEGMICRGPKYWAGDDIEKIPTCQSKPSLSGSKPQADLWHQANYREFLNFMVSNFNVRFSTIEEAHVTMQVIMQCGLHWMLQKRRPLELGFCRLMAFPYRANWQNVLAGNGRVLAAVRSGKRKHLFKCAREFVSGHASAWNSYQPRWTLTVTPCGQFHRVTAKAETARRRSLGQKNPEISGASTLASVIMEMRREMAHRAPYAIEAFEEYWKACQAAFMDFPSRFGAGNRTRINKEDAARIRRFNLKIPQDIGTDKPVQGGKTRNRLRSFRLASSTAKRLFQVSDIQPRTENMRKSGVNVGEPADGAGGADGLSVLHADGRKTSLQEMLA